MYDRKEIESTCHLNQRSLLTLALLLGSDYDSQGLHGIGRENALKFLQAIPHQTDPVDYLRTIVSRNSPQNKYEQRIFTQLNENPSVLKHFERIIREYSSTESIHLPVAASVASIKWLKPVRIRQLQSYMKNKLGWMESYTFAKVFPLLTRFQILYRLNMLELDVSDTLSLSETTIFQPMGIKKRRMRQCKCYFEVEWKQHELPSTQTLDEQMNNLSLIVVAEDDDEEKLITIEPADLFRHAYPEVVTRFEAPLVKTKKMRKPATCTTARKKRAKEPSAIATSTSMSLDLLSMIDDETYEIPWVIAAAEHKPSKFHHRATMAALSTSISIDVLSVLQKSHGNLNALRKPRSRPIQRFPRSDSMLQSKSIRSIRTGLILAFSSSTRHSAEYVDVPGRIGHSPSRTTAGA